VLKTARRLVDAALDAGGHDNITVAMKPLGAPTWGVEGGAGTPEAEAVEAVAAEALGAPEPVSETPPEAAQGIESPPASESHESEE
jgi:serine/threonine protein phosphatase PrpC